MLEMTKEDEIPAISQRIRQLREDRDLSQKALGKLVGVTDSAITYWENGDRFPRGSNLKKLAKALGVSESDILGETDLKQTQTSVTMDRAQRTLRLQSLINQLSDDDFDTIETTVEGLAQLAPNKSSIAR
jgi:transcriptional regulator with XRE-family HTH domain